ncbi:MAG: dUTP diphosphatase [Bacilli bacterium]|nr:dUTP diphosphatase [Bacilli bacterium]
MTKIRGFEVAKGFEDKGINLPVRSTRLAAGYDVEAAEDVIIPTFVPGQKPVLVKTGLKAYCQDDEYYMLLNRSSGPFKRGLVLANSVGIIDADYYGNESTDGHFMYAFYNFFDHDVEIKKGDVIGQVIFQKYLLVDNDHAIGERTGGIGSTGR